MKRVSNMYESGLLEAATPGVIRILARYRDQGRLAEIAKKIDVHAPRLTEILNGSRKLSFLYLILFLRSGIMTVDEVFRNVDLSKLPKESRVVVEMMRMDTDVIELVLTAQSQGVDIKSMLKAVIKPV